MHKYIRTYLIIHIQIYIRNIHLLHTYIHNYIYTNIHTYIYTYIHT